MNFLELPLFQSLSDQELEQMKTSSCLRTASYKKNDIIFSTGSTVSEIGIVLSGSVNVENIDFWGNKSILGNMNEGHIFAKLTNDSRENKTLELKVGEGFMQGIFVEYGITVDDDATAVRNGGFGSTTK